MKMPIKNSFIILFLYPQILTDAVEIECELLTEALPVTLIGTESVPRREEGSTGKYQHEVEGVPEGAARGNS